MADEKKTPKLQIFNETHTAIQETWNAGTLDIGSGESFESQEKVINVWNNKGGVENVPDLVGCTITTKNINGDVINSQVVTEQWVKVCVDSMASTDSAGRKIFSPVGYNPTTKEVIKCDIAHQNASADDKTNCVIKGTANNGSATDALNNYAKITIKIVPEIKAMIQTHYFKTRISGYYV